MTETYKGYLEYAQKLMNESDSVEPDEALQQICAYGMMNTTYGITRITDKKFLAGAKDKEDYAIRDDFLTQVCSDMDPSKRDSLFLKELFDLWDIEEFCCVSGVVVLILTLSLFFVSLVMSDSAPYEKSIVVTLTFIGIAYLLCIGLIYGVNYLFKLRDRYFYVFRNNCKKWNWKELITESRLPVYTFFGTSDKEDCRQYKEAMYYAMDKEALRNVKFAASELIADDEFGDIVFSKIV